MFAGFTDETPRDYLCNLGPDGRRRDADERPELCRGTVEFVASKEYMVSETMRFACLECTADPYILTEYFILLFLLSVTT